MVIGEVSRRSLRYMRRGELEENFSRFNEDVFRSISKGRYWRRDLLWCVSIRRFIGEKYSVTERSLICIYGRLSILTRFIY